MGLTRVKPNDMQRIKRDILATYSRKLFIPKKMGMGDLEQYSTVKVYFRKKGKGYTWDVVRKGKKLPIGHPVIMGVDKKRRSSRW